MYSTCVSTDGRGFMGYQNLHEETVIKGIELKAAKKIGYNLEGITRSDHGVSSAHPTKSWKPRGEKTQELSNTDNKPDINNSKTLRYETGSGTKEMQTH